MNTLAFETGTILAVVGSILAVLIAIIGYFLNREFGKTDNIKETLTSVDNKTTVFENTLKNITSSIESINEKFDNINEKFDSVNDKLQAIDKDGSTTKHELEMISSMIKPLFEMKDTVDKTSEAISELFKRSEVQKEALNNIYERLKNLENRR